MPGSDTVSVGGRRAVISIDWVFRRELSASSGVASSPASRSRAAGDACVNAVGRVLINRTGRRPPANVRLKRIADFKSYIATCPMRVKMSRATHFLGTPGLPQERDPPANAARLL